MSETPLTPVSTPQVTPETARPDAPATPLFSLRHWIIFGSGAAVCAVLFILGALGFRRTLDDYQSGLPRYAAERALAALGRGDKDALRQELDLVLKETPIRQNEGLFGSRPVNEVWDVYPVMRNRVSILEQLTGKLLADGQVAPAEAVGWKMILEFHIASRILEHIDLWEWMFHIKAIGKDWTSSFEALKILSAHGVSRVREPAQIEPAPAAVPPALLSEAGQTFPSDLPDLLRQYYQASTPDEYSSVADLLLAGRGRFQNPDVRGKVLSVTHQCLINADRRPEARRILASLLGREPDFMDSFWRDWPRRPGSTNLLDRDPSLLGMMWRDRPSSATLSLSEFLDSFKGDPRATVVDFTRLNRKDIGYFNPSNKLFHGSEYVNLSQSVAGSMPVQLSGPVSRVYIAYEGPGALGIHPILLVRVGDRPYVPLYCASDRPDLIYFDVKLDGPAQYNFEFVYLNDAAFEYKSKGIRENRDLHLFRMMLVQAPGAK